jgi:hypothetical protein
VFDGRKQQIHLRPTALSRFMLFGSYKRMPGENILAMLAEPSFDPRRVALLPSLKLQRKKVSSELRSNLGVRNLEKSRENHAWHSNSGEALPQWIIHTYGKPTVLNQLILSPQATSIGGSEHERAPSDFELQGSNDGKSWKRLLKVNDLRFDRNAKSRSWSFDNSKPFRHYRLFIHAVANGGSLVTVSTFHLTAVDKSLPSMLARSLNYDSVVSDRITLDVVANKKSLLFFNDTYHYGWKALIDGRKVEVEPTNHAFMGVMVPEGSHRVEFRFEPESLLWIGRFQLAAAVLFVLFLGGFCALSWRKGDRPSWISARRGGSLR